ncbi:MAG: methionyl-tRNA formyltransferase [Candidatus Marinimicrobia bacterium]|nr:methionyl-tRNA formyltransferase [Candidatus Neomarinimicrobiota bacterium]
MGTPDFAVPSLIKLTENGYKPSAVITGLDKKMGRGQKIIPTPVKMAAVDLKIPVLEPKNLKDPAFHQQIEKFDIDLSCVVAFRILPQVLIDIPQMGSINLHSSLLPKYRGAAPIQRAIMAGEKETGATTFFIRRKVDTGNILFRDKLKIGELEDFGSLHDRLAELGAELLLKTVRAVESGSHIEDVQDDSQATDAPKISRDDLRIDWNRSAVELHNQVRALSPYPGVTTNFNGKVLKIFKTVPVAKIIKDRGPGQVIEVGKDSFSVSTGDGGLKVLEVQREGKKRMTSADFLRGTNISAGDSLA